jgi:AcrR family transcriptional regulator
MEIKERIIQGAGKLFFARGIKRVTMDEIASEAGVSKRTIYENFDDKTQLLKETLDYFQHEHDCNLKRMTEQADNVIEIIIGILHYGLESIKVVNPLFMEDLKKFYPRIWDESVRKSRESGQMELQRLLERGKREGLLRPDINPHLVARIFYEQITLIHNNEAFPIDEFPRKELFENIVLNFGRGISTPKGVEMLEKLLSDPDSGKNGPG